MINFKLILSAIVFTIQAQLLFGVNNVWVGQNISPWPSPQSNIDTIETRNGNRHVDFVEHWINWTADFSDMSDECTAIYNNGSVLELAWQPHNGTRGLYNSEINSGAWDSYITSYVTAIKNWGKLMYIRPMHEWNGDWYDWSVGKNSNTNASFIAAFQRFVNIADSVGATNIRWGFSVAQENKGSNTFLGPYPGDSYVDYMSIDCYNWGTSHPNWPSTWQSFAICFNSAYSAFAAKGKPIFISEIGSVEVGGNKAAWISEVYNQVRNSGNYNLVDAIIWFDTDYTAPGNQDAFQITSSTAALNAYIAATNYVSNPLPTLSTDTQAPGVPTGLFTPNVTETSVTLLQTASTNLKSALLHK